MVAQRWESDMAKTTLPYEPTDEELAAMIQAGKFRVHQREEEAVRQTGVRTAVSQKREGSSTDKTDI